MADTAIVAALPHCQTHKFIYDDDTVIATYDAKTSMGPWAYMCESCWKQFGPGKLGTGFGQKLVVR